MKADTMLKVWESRGKREMNPQLLPWDENRRCTICSLPSHARHESRPAVYSVVSCVTNGLLHLCEYHAKVRFIQAGLPKSMGK